MTLALQRRPSRGLSDLRTLTGRSDTQTPAHKAYLRISFLELERARRTQEMQAYCDRFDAIRTRFREIDAEIAGIRSNLDGTAPRAQAIQAPHRSPVGFRPKTRHFQINY
jgi:hypothetical protein